MRLEPVAGRKHTTHPAGGYPGKEGKSGPEGSGLIRRYSPGAMIAGCSISGGVENQGLKIFHKVGAGYERMGKVPPSCTRLEGVFTAHAERGHALRVNASVCTAGPARALLEGAEPQDGRGTRKNHVGKSGS